MTKQEKKTAAQVIVMLEELKRITKKSNRQGRSAATD